MNPPVSQAPIIVRMQDVGLSLRAKMRRVDILRQINLTIHEGETVSITGPSGSGKSSLVMLIAGLEAPTGGIIHVCGANIANMNENKLALWRARNVGIVFQSFQLIPTMSALENVAMPLEFIKRKDALRTAAATLEMLGLSHRAHHYPAQLSGGEQQRVAIARAFVARPKLLLADEPTGNLDTDTGQQVIDLLLRLHEEIGTTLLLVTHDTALAQRCQRIVQLADGRIANEHFHADAAC